jgi:hypothetical protein
MEHLFANYHWTVRAVPELLADLASLMAELRQSDEAVDAGNLIRLTQHRAKQHFCSS